MKILDKDIATVEALHDMMIDNYGVSIDHPTLVKSRALTSKMYASMGYTRVRNENGTMEYLL